MEANIKLKNKFRLKFAITFLPLVYRLGFKKTAHRLSDWLISDAEKDIEKYVDIKVYLGDKRIK